MTDRKTHRDERMRTVEPATTAQLRRDIDEGRTGDKVKTIDPALSPLGTDDEAAGTPPGPRAIDTARRQEKQNRAPGESSASPRMQHSYAFILLLGALILAALAIVVWVTVRA